MLKPYFSTWNKNWTSETRGYQCLTLFALHTFGPGEVSKNNKQQKRNWLQGRARKSRRWLPSGMAVYVNLCNNVYPFRDYVTMCNLLGLMGGK